MHKIITPESLGTVVYGFQLAFINIKNSTDEKEN